MNDNVFEWCWDWGTTTTLPTGAETDYRGDASGTSRVKRGGSYNEYEAYMRIGYRNLNTPYGESSTYGLRLAKKP